MTHVRLLAVAPARYFAAVTTSYRVECKGVAAGRHLETIAFESGRYHRGRAYGHSRLREWVFVGSPVTFCGKVFRAGYLSYAFLFSTGAGCCQALSNFSIDPALMSVAGSALLFGIGTEALP